MKIFDKKVKKYLAGVLTFTMALSFSPIQSINAAEYAQVATVISKEKKDSKLAAKKNLPVKFDLRNEGVVTPVKNSISGAESWSYAGVSAAETAILSAMGKAYSEKALDLSEKHLTYFSKKAISKTEDACQESEGRYATDTAKLLSLSADNPNYGSLICSLYASNVGPADESAFAYDIAKDGVAIPEKDTDGKYLRFKNAGYTLKNGNALPELVILDDKQQFSEVNTDGENAVKSELLRGNGVIVSCSAAYDNLIIGNDQIVSGELSNFDNSRVVTIVGWDDSYDKSNFGNDDQIKENGAWLCKSEYSKKIFDINKDSSSSDLNAGAGSSTEYFWVSYSDKSLKNPVSLEFAAIDDAKTSNVVQYDYMPASMTYQKNSKEVMSSANQFTVAEDCLIESISTKTSNANTKNAVSVYKLKKDAKNPTDGELLYNGTVNYSYAGFHRINLDKTVSAKKGDVISVVVTSNYYDENGDKQYEVASNMDVSKEKAAEKSLTYGGKAVVGKGESYICENGIWSDWSEYIKKSGEEDPVYGLKYSEMAIDNFSIKLYTKKDTSAVVTSTPTAVPTAVVTASPAPETQSVEVKESVTIKFGNKLAFDKIIKNGKITKIVNQEKNTKYFTIDNKKANIVTKLINFNKINIKTKFNLKVYVEGEEKPRDLVAKLKFENPVIKITRKFNKAKNGCRFTFKYNIKSAKNIKVRANHKIRGLEKDADKYVSKKKSNKESYLEITNLTYKLKFKIIAYYGKNIQKKANVVVCKVANRKKNKTMSVTLK